jgi:hypothetical protein
MGGMILKGDPYVAKVYAVKYKDGSGKNRSIIDTKRYLKDCPHYMHFDEGFLKEDVDYGLSDGSAEIVPMPPKAKTEKAA